MLPHFTRVACAGALSLSFVPMLLRAQDVVKPRATPPTFTRLVAPSAVVARQLPDGRIEVSWTRVSGATAYRLTRSVPNLHPEQPISPDPRDTTYVDSDVTAGYYYYYALAAVNDAGGIGLKRGSAPVKATISAGQTTTTNTTTTPAPRPPAPVFVDNYHFVPQHFEVTWAELPGARDYTVERWIFRPDSADRMKVDVTSGRLEKTAKVTVTTTMFNTNDRRYVDSLAAAGEFRWVQYRVRPGAYPESFTASSPFKLVPPGGRTIAPTPTPTTGTPVAPAGTLSPTRSAGVGVGRSLALGAITGIANAQWVSADPSIATMSADSVTGRTPGTVSVVAIVPLADGSVRATVVRVNVVP